MITDTNLASHRLDQPGRHDLPVKFLPIFVTKPFEDEAIPSIPSERLQDPESRSQHSDNEIKIEDIPKSLEELASNDQCSRQLNPLLLILTINQW